SAQLSPDDAIDREPNSRWCADNADMPQWWALDLGATESVAGVDLKWEFGDGRYRFRVELGPDESHLTAIADRTSGAGVGDGKVEWPATNARFLRITVVGATDAAGEAKWASIREVAITVVRDGRRIPWT